MCGSFVTTLTQCALWVSCVLMFLCLCSVSTRAFACVCWGPLLPFKYGSNTLNCPFVSFKNTNKSATSILTMVIHAASNGATNASSREKITCWLMSYIISRVKCVGALLFVCRPHQARPTTWITHPSPHEFNNFVNTAHTCQMSCS